MFEILVVDNSTSDDSTRQVVAAFDGVRYVHEPIPGLDTARNRALLEASGDLVALLDDDVVADADWLLGLVEAHSENPDAAVFTGLILPLELSTSAQVAFERRGGFRLAFGAGFEKARYGRQRTGDRGYPAQAGRFGAGANMTLNRTAIRQLGGFDEALDTGAPLAGGGDLDMFYRVIRAGLPLVFEPRMLVFHRHRNTEKALRAQYESWGKGYMAFVSKSYATDPENRRGLRLAVRMWIAYQATQLAQSVRATDVDQLRYVAREIWGGVVGILGAYHRSAHRMERLRRSTP
jgi:GT2 family glycosyltransferase